MPEKMEECNLVQLASVFQKYDTCFSIMNPHKTHVEVLSVCRGESNQLNAKRRGSQEHLTNSTTVALLTFSPHLISICQGLLVGFLAGLTLFLLEQQLLQVPQKSVKWHFEK